MVRLTGAVFIALAATLAFPGKCPLLASYVERRLPTPRHRNRTVFHGPAFAVTRSLAKLPFSKVPLRSSM